MLHSPGPYARTETTLAQAQITEARDGPAAAISHIRQAGTGLPAYQGLLSGDPALAAWLVRTSLAAGDQPLANQVTGTAVALADANPDLGPGRGRGPQSGPRHPRHGTLGEAVAQHPDPWAKASAAEDLAVLLTDTAKDQAIGTSRPPSTATARPAPTATRPASGGGCASSASAAAAGPRPPPGPSPAGTASPTPASRVPARRPGTEQQPGRCPMYISTHTVAHHCARHSANCRSLARRTSPHRHRGSGSRS